jgi:outer membrane lipoprotein-sorting protein
MFRRMMMALAAVALLSPLAYAQTVDELVAKNIAARGGMEKLKAVKSMKYTGKMVVQGMELPLVMYSKRPKSSRMEFTFQGMTGFQAYDGKNAWGVMPFMGKKDPEPMGAEEQKAMDEQADFDGALVDYKEKGHTLELMGKEQVEGAEAHKLKMTMKNGDVRYIYLDAETFLEVKVDAKRTIRGTEVEGESLMGDFREEGGLMMAHTIDNGAKGMPQRQKFIIEKVELNVDLPDSLFAMPASLAAKSDSLKAAASAADTAKAAGTAKAGEVKDAAKAKAAESTADAKKSATKKK